MTSNSLKQSACSIVRTLQNAGYTAYIVGGAPRDMLMGIEPKDYDIATDASPDNVAGLFDRIYPVGKKFGVSLVVIGGHSFEVSQFRKEGVYLDGRRPAEIEPAGETEDVNRRDFTINGILYDPEHDEFIDHVSGREDIDKGIIRAIGDPVRRFEEDHLRMLRAVRFAARFRFCIDPDTFMAIRRNAGKIKRISAERIGEELSKMFSGPHPADALTILDDTGLLKVVLPEVYTLKGVEQPKTYHPEGDVFEHTRLMLELFGGGSVTLAFGILLHDIAKPQTKTLAGRIRFHGHDKIGSEMAGAIMRRLRFPGDTVKKVRALVGGHMRFINASHMKQSTLRRFIAEDNFSELLELHRLDCLASHGNLDIYGSVKSEAARIERERETLKLPKPLVDGKYLISLGYKPGKEFTTILNSVTDAQLEGKLRTKEEAALFIRKMFPLPPGSQKR